MTTNRRSSVAKRERVIPVKVTVDPRPAPTSLPPLPTQALTSTKPLSKSVAGAKAAMAKPVQAMRLPVHEWPIERRRKLMWWLVGGGMTVIIIGWATLARYEFSSGPNRPNLFNDVGRLLRTIHFPTVDMPTPAQQEIDDLDQQVFPQFQK